MEGGDGEIAVNESDNISHSCPVVYEIFVSGKSHQWHNIQESKTSWNLKRIASGEKGCKSTWVNFWSLLPKTQCHGWGFRLSLLAWIALKQQEQHGTVWLVGPWESFPHNSAGIKVKSWPQLITRNSQEQAWVFPPPGRASGPHPPVLHDRRRGTRQAVRHRETVGKWGFQWNIIRNFKTNQNCASRFVLRNLERASNNNCI